MTPLRRRIVFAWLERRTAEYYAEVIADFGRPNHVVFDPPSHATVVDLFDRSSHAAIVDLFNKAPRTAVAILAGERGSELIASAPADDKPP